VERAWFPGKAQRRAPALRYLARMTQALSRSEFRARYGPWALVAGASEGFGAAWARELAARGCDVVLVARREAQLGALAREIERAQGVATRCVIADLAARDIDTQLARATATLDVGLLVTNAA
jgi:short-subunit dehydrogenase